MEMTNKNLSISSQDGNSNNIMESLIEKVVDMGFYKNFLCTEGKDGTIKFSCQRIHKCSCNCNDGW